MRQDRVVSYIFWKEDFIRKSTKAKNYAIYKIYTYMYIPPPAAYTNTICDDPGLRDRNLTQIRNTKTDVTKYKFIAVKPNQSNC